MTKESDGESLYRNSWITNHELTPQQVIQLVSGGRSRWKTENENHNVLKTRGYHLEHNARTRTAAFGKFSVDSQSVSFPISYSAATDG